uniref:Uncharacterized protein n=1 Tax=Arundo donax TaxID=35708 RepID=A0A0A8ZPV2_ARUDO
MSLTVGVPRQFGEDYGGQR